ncbi:MAG: RnfABCDGE type electron transport complex subunit B [Oscillospiraceae bacterium]|nr:RnfABCDGE type electron transport complex subunit B [Oscillospiraceae bacterium]
MNEILTAVLTIGGLGLLFGVVLAVSSKLFAVVRDERLELLVDAMPGANCAACGYSGCSLYASAILNEGAAINLCPVGGDSAAETFAAIMGVDAAKPKRVTALVRCMGGVRAKKKFVYAGINDCVAAARIGGGPLECSHGCFGLGTCAAACRFGAISIVDEVAVVDSEKCTGCTLCIEACPNNIIAMSPYEADVQICCVSTDKGGLLRKICEIGCVGCRMCEKVCKHDAIHVENNLASIDYSKCNNCGDCAEKCPRKLISDANFDKGPKADDSEQITANSDNDMDGNE